MVVTNSLPEMGLEEVVLPGTGEFAEDDGLERVRPEKEVGSQWSIHDVWGDDQWSFGDIH